MAAELDQVDVVRVRDRRLHRERRQQRDADVRGDHLAQRFEAGRAEAALLAGAGELADLERLVAQAMAVFEQQQALVGRDRRASAALRVRAR